jgi:hypothetical protein
VLLRWGIDECCLAARSGSLACAGGKNKKGGDMLPWWVNDTATLMTIVLGAPPITGWLLHWLGRGLQPELPPPREDIRRYRQRVTIVGSLKTALIHIAINPEVPFWHDVAKVVFGTVILLGDIIAFIFFF